MRFTILLLVLPVWALSCQNPAAADSAVATYTFGAAELLPDQGQRLPVGSLAYVKINSQGSDGGYWWYYTVDNPAMVQVLDEKTFPTSDAVGASPLYIVRFKIIGSGDSALEFRNYRSWEGPEKAVAVKTYRISAP